MNQGRTLPFEIFKYSGAGNTFALIDARENLKFDTWEKENSYSRPKLAQIFCSADSGIGVDGLVLLSQSKTFEWTWDFYNNDGSTAEMCGNASRCAIAFIESVLSTDENQKGIVVDSQNSLMSRPVNHSLDTEVSIQTSAGPIQGKMLVDGNVEVKMTHGFHVEKELEIGGESMTLLDTGVPHLVFSGPPKIKEVSRMLRHHPDLGSRGANVTNYVELSPKHIRAQSYERGVEDFTLACGTGAVAAAFEYWRRSDSFPKEQWILVSMPGGDLQIFCSKMKKPIMRGPAILVGKFQLSNDIF